MHHLGIVLSGRMHVVHGDGSEVGLNADDVYEIQPGHDAWVLGDEQFTGVEFDPTTVATFAAAGPSGLVRPARRRARRTPG